MWLWVFWVCYVSAFFIVMYFSVQRDRHKLAWDLIMIDRKYDLPHRKRGTLEKELGWWRQELKRRRSVFYLIHDKQLREHRIQRAEQEIADLTAELFLL